MTKETEKKLKTLLKVSTKVIIYGVGICVTVWILIVIIALVLGGSTVVETLQDLGDKIELNKISLSR